MVDLITEVTAALRSKQGTEPNPQRNLYLASPILFPLEALAPSRAGEQPARQP